MANGRDIEVWNNHAKDCRDMKRKKFEFLSDTPLTTFLKNLKDVNNVLDFGCGPGYWSNLFKGKKYTGVDQSSAMIELAKELANDGEEFRLIVNSGIPPLRGTQKYDLIFTASVMQHNGLEDKIKILNAFKEVTSIGSYYLCTENTYRSDNCMYVKDTLNDCYTDGFSYTAKGWTDLLNDNGWKLLSFSEPGEYLFQRVS